MRKPWKLSKAILITLGCVGFALMIIFPKNHLTQKRQNTEEVAVIMRTFIKSNKQIYFTTTWKFTKYKRQRQALFAGQTGRSSIRYPSKEERFFP